MALVDAHGRSLGRVIFTKREIKLTINTKDVSAGD
jgi:hypothetical protein